jgi:hypothetical protein
MKAKIIDDIIELRSSISFLMEKSQWWELNFNDSSSRDFLAYIFPKSSNAQFLCSCIALRSCVDNEVGANYYHLFRLPMSIEELISNRAKSTRIRSYDSKEEALQALKEKALDLTADQREGPKYIGSVDHFNEDVIQVLAAEHLIAFQDDYKVFPYLN